MDKNLRADMEFIVELDKMKSTLRKTSLIGRDQYEDDAQHSWHIAVMAMTLEEYAEENLDIEKVIKMLLIHDIVEIYAGDTFAYDEKGYEDKLQRETRAAEKIYGMLSNGKGEKFKALWEEFEYMETREAYFAASMDRLQPILNNYYNNGGTWVEHKITTSKVLKRIEPIKETSKELYEFALGLIDSSVEKGYLIRD